MENYLDAPPNTALLGDKFKGTFTPDPVIGGSRIQAPVVALPERSMIPTTVATQSGSGSSGSGPTAAEQVSGWAQAINAVAGFFTGIFGQNTMVRTKDEIMYVPPTGGDTWGKNPDELQRQRMNKKDGREAVAELGLYPWEGGEIEKLARLNTLMQRKLTYFNGKTDDVGLNPMIILALKTKGVQGWKDWEERGIHPATGVNVGEMWRVQQQAIADAAAGGGAPPADPGAPSGGQLFSIGTAFKGSPLKPAEAGWGWWGALVLVLIIAGNFFFGKNEENPTLGSKRGARGSAPPKPASKPKTKAKAKTKSKGVIPPKGTPERTVYYQELAAKGRAAKAAKAKKK